MRRDRREGGGGGVGDDIYILRYFHVNLRLQCYENGRGRIEREMGKEGVRK
jgi:hypothetical protein